jgi:hypothetical protein
VGLPVYKPTSNGFWRLPEATTNENRKLIEFDFGPRVMLDLRAQPFFADRVSGGERWPFGFLGRVTRPYCPITRRMKFVSVPT